MEEFKRLTAGERQEMDVTRLQQYLMQLGNYGADLTELLVQATDDVTKKRAALVQAEGLIERLKKQQSFVKEEKSLIQTILRTIPV